MAGKKRAAPRVVKPGPRSMTKIDAGIGPRIRAMRLDRDVSQQELGVALGISFQQIQKYEKGINRVTYGRLQQIAERLKTNITELAGNGGQQTDGFMFDNESYKLAKAFSGLPHHVKGRMRSLIDAIIKGSDE